MKLVSIASNPIAFAGGKGKEGKIVLEDGQEFGPFDDIITAIG